MCSGLPIESAAPWDGFPFRGCHFRGGSQCVGDPDSRFLVASPPASDLLLSAKHLFVAATAGLIAFAGDILRLAGGAFRSGMGLHSALRTTARDEGVYQRYLPFASLQLMTSLAVGRTISDVNPPAAVPQITGADT